LSLAIPPKYYVISTKSWKVPLRISKSVPDSIPFLDLVTPHVALEQELISVFRQVLLTAGFIGGPMVEEFETAFAAFCNAKHSIAISSGTDALRFAIMACGVQPGEVVLTVPHTFIATTEAISQAGAVPEFVDIDEDTYNISPDRLQQFLEEQCVRSRWGQLISRRSGRAVTAVVPVHLYGQMADMDAILQLADRYGLIVIEDACQAHGAEYFSKELNRWMKAGSMGRAAAFSFYPGKNLGACGEAGAVTTNDGAIADRIKVLRDHGQTKKYHHEVEGYNGRLDAIQAGLLHAKLAHLADWNLQRRERAVEYNRLLAGNDGLILPYEPSWSRAVYHLYVVRTENRDGMMNHLKKAGIGTGIHYPIPLHLQKAYAFMNYSLRDFPVAGRVASEIVSLPMFPQLTAEQQTRVAEEISAFTAKFHTKRAEGEEISLVPVIQTA
jgi:dTDP-4-amino-4,6-dideoxygalactose transaminase